MRNFLCHLTEQLDELQHWRMEENQEVQKTGGRVAVGRARHRDVISCPNLLQTLTLCFALVTFMCAIIILQIVISMKVRIKL